MIKSTRSKAASVLLLLSLACVASCAPHKQFQKEWPHTQVTDSSGTERQAKHVAVVEVDSSGTFWDAKQLDAAVDFVKGKNKPLLVTFVHGWRHNAKPDDQDFIQFNQFIEQLNKKNLGGHTVCGLYVGWHGATVNEHVKGMKWVTSASAVFSFWRVKRGTDRVCTKPDVSQILNQTAAAAWGKGGKVALIGHSFGGRIVEQIYGVSASGQSGDLDSFKPVADLAVLINPASESLTARNIKLSLKKWNREYPLIAAIGATNDGANGKAWTWGYRVAPQPPTRDFHIDLKQGDNVKRVVERQRHYLDTTVTNDKRQITHALVKDCAQITTPDDTFAANLKGDANFDVPIWIRSHEENASPKAYLLNKLDTTKVEGVDHVIASKAYWAFQVPTEVLSGHSGDRSKGGVLATPMTDLLTAIFTRTSLLARKKGGASVPFNPKPL